ncbi:hypothetical protein NFI96_030498 [Prochilodus magdalenae]|nr:hypothetical protein NFI96_030498 [Prochilodus magdalenae]
MMFLCSLSLFIIMIESCVSQSISPLEEKVDAVEGETAALSCRYVGSADYLYWYRQYPGSRPEFLLRIDPSTKAVRRADPPVPGLDVKVNVNKLDLEISSSKISDSVLYYCALWPTVTRSPSTLYKNSLTDKDLRCVWGFLSDPLIHVGGVSTCWNSRTQISPHYLNTGTTMMFLCSLSLFIIMIESCVSQSISPLEEKVDAVEESCVSQSISPLEEKVDAVEGETVTLSCSYTGRADYLYWYRQYPGSRPEFLLRIDPDDNFVLRATPPFPGLDVKLTGTKLDLKISSTKGSDSVLYYCALRPTVTRSPSTLYKNSLTDKALRCVWGFLSGAALCISSTQRDVVYGLYWSYNYVD